MWKYISSGKWIWIREPAVRIDNGRKHSKSKSATFDQRFPVIMLTKLWKDINLFSHGVYCRCRSKWPCGLSCRSSAARLLRSWVRILPGAWMFVCRECCVLSGRGLCDGLMTRPEESYRLWGVVVCDQETSKKRRLKPVTGLWKIQPRWVVTPGKQKQTYIADIFA
jgi:hypothetical protein